MFETLESKIKSRISEARASDKKNIKVSRSSQETIPFDTLTTDHVCCVGNKYSACFEMKNINYHLEKDNKKISIINGFNNFLKSRGENFQILLINENEDINNYVDSLKISDPVYEKDFNINKNHLLDLSRTRDLVNKKKYLIISRVGNYKDATVYFGKQESEINNYLKNFKSGIRRMERMEYLKIFYDYLNPATKKSHPFDLNMSLFKIDIKDSLAPSVNFFPISNYFISGDYHLRNFYIRDFPNDITDEILKVFSLLPFENYVSIHYSPTNKADVKEYLKRRETDLTSSKLSHKKNNREMPSVLEEDLDNTKEYYDKLNESDEVLIGVGIYVSIYAENLEVLKERTKIIYDRLRIHSVKIYPAMMLQEEVLKAIFPVNDNHLNIQRPLLSKQASYLIPYDAVELFNPNGFYYVINSDTKSMCIVDRKSDIINPLGFIFGTSGSGKTYEAKDEVKNVILHTNDDVIYVDPDNDIEAVTKYFNGHFIDLSVDEVTINPFDLNSLYNEGKNPIPAKSSFIVGLTEKMNNGLNDGDRSVIDKAVVKSYAGLIKSNYNYNKVPFWDQFVDNIKKDKSDVATRLALNYELYTTGSYSKFLNGKTNVELNNRFTSFGLRNITHDFKPIAMYILFDYIWNRILHNFKQKKFTWLFFDEFQEIIDTSASLDYVIKLWLRLRKYFGIPTGISQNLENVFLNQQATTFIINAKFSRIFDVGDFSELVKKVYNFSSAQMEHITNSESGHGLMKVNDIVLPFDAIISKEYGKLFSTKPTDFADG